MCKYKNTITHQDATLFSQIVSFHFQDCKKTETVEIICPKCLKNFCMAHRLEADHECQVRPGEYMPKTAQLVEQILANKSSQQVWPLQLCLFHVFFENN